MDTLNSGRTQVSGKYKQLQLFSPIDFLSKYCLELVFIQRSCLLTGESSLGTGWEWTGWPRQGLADLQDSSPYLLPPCAIYRAGKKISKKALRPQSDKCTTCKGDNLKAHSVPPNWQRNTNSHLTNLVARTSRIVTVWLPGQIVVNLAHHFLPTVCCSPPQSSAHITVPNTITLLPHCCAHHLAPKNHRPSPNLNPPYATSHLLKTPQTVTLPLSFPWAVDALLVSRSVSQRHIMRTAVDSINSVEAIYRPPILVYNGCPLLIHPGAPLLLFPLQCVSLLGFPVLPTQQQHLPTVTGEPASPKHVPGNSPPRSLSLCGSLRSRRWRARPLAPPGKFSSPYPSRHRRLRWAGWEEGFEGVGVESCRFVQALPVWCWEWGSWRSRGG